MLGQTQICIGSTIILILRQETESQWEKPVMLHIHLKSPEIHIKIDEL